jgi:exodeoxyribonuclease VII large subunit
MLGVMEPDAPARGNVPEFSVSEISNALKQTIEQSFDNVRVRGEISGFKRHSSGHLYFALKDAEAVLDAVCWRGSAGRLQIQPEDGMEVVAAGRLTTYPGRSKYQMVVERLELAGQGALLKLLEDRKKKLAAEGLFEPSRKKKIPFLPEVIGVVTSPTGAVIRDILHRLSDRFPRPVLLWPVAVQGEGAARQIADAIDGFNALAKGGPVPRPDLLIVARGGGSLEDLWAFNEEIVVRAAAASEIPLISAVGHETDTTLIDFAADLRAPTPTGAAEMAVPVRAELLLKIRDQDGRMLAAMQRLLTERRTRLDGLGRGLGDPRRRLEELGQRLDDWSERLPKALLGLARHQAGQLAQITARLGPALKMRRAAELARLERDQLRVTQAAARLDAAWPRLLAERQSCLAQNSALLDSYSYEQVLKRGFALVRDKAGHAVTSAAQAKPGDHWSVLFADQQSVAVTVDGSPPRKEAAKDNKDGRQGSLL